MKRALALVIGINEYKDQHLNILTNAVNDADDIDAKLFDLGFLTIKKTNCNKLDFNLAIDEFGKKLISYDVGLFYFSGHAFQLNGKNYIATGDSRMNSDVYAKETCISLDFILELMEDSKVEIKIVILDACRNNPLPGNFRGADTNLAPIHAPKGTLIAFSTSPGERAEDKGMGRNSIYTGSILAHIDDPDIPIEVLFKRVRTSVVTLSKENQTPWEHTSLVGNFYFSSGELVHAVELPYEQMAVVSELFVSDGCEIHKMIEDLSSTDFRDQNAASDKISSFAFNPSNISMLFLLGRKLLWAAYYGAFHAKKRIQNLKWWIDRFESNGENHLLNGILFEIYFNSKGKLRNDGFKTDQLDDIYANEKTPSFIPSFNFIRNQLIPFRGRVLFLPNDPIVVIEAKIVEEEVIYFDEENPVKMHKILSLKHETIELLHFPVGRRNLNNLYEDKYDKFIEFVSKGLAIPKAKLNLVSQFKPKDIKWIGMPHYYKLGKYPEWKS